MFVRTLNIALIAAVLASCSSDNGTDQLPTPVQAPPAEFETMRVESNGSIEGVWLLASSGNEERLEVYATLNSNVDIVKTGFRTVLVTLNDSGDRVTVQRCKDDGIFEQTGEKEYTDIEETAGEESRISRYTFSADGSVRYHYSISEIHVSEGQSDSFKFVSLLEGSGYKISNSTTFDDVRFNHSLTINQLTNTNGEQVYQNTEFGISCIEHSKSHLTINETTSGSAALYDKRYGESVEEELVVRAKNDDVGELAFNYSEIFFDISTVSGDEAPIHAKVRTQRGAFSPGDNPDIRYNNHFTQEDALTSSRFGDHQFESNIQSSEGEAEIDVDVDIGY
ncbi:Uncharacterised protein [BD1-7 clade bacterium]|uniref:Uncharacterized protein n=1 Tax=BD1-7 clade bacterium TaxID=2029982 RepID=A0A5S9PHF3_9GAMM|nr:Uncharacterised protein [BD1-7 clade bacterium]CAA0103330.1 Uncharacterised protein [BD1-7 clade bacterium]